MLDHLRTPPIVLAGTPLMTWTTLVAATIVIAASDTLPTRAT